MYRRVKRKFPPPLRVFSAGVGLVLGGTQGLGTLPGSRRHCHLESSWRKGRESRRRTTGFWRLWPGSGTSDPCHVPWWTLVTGARMGKVTPSPVSTMARDRRRRGSATCAWHHFRPLRPAPVPALLFLESVQARDIPGKRIKEAWFMRQEPPAVGFLVRHRADPLHRSCCQAAPAPRSVVWDSSPPLSSSKPAPPGRSSSYRETHSHPELRSPTPGPLSLRRLEPAA